MTDDGSRLEAELVKIRDTGARIPLAVVAYDPETGNILFANEASTALVGEMVGEGNPIEQIIGEREGLERRLDAEEKGGEIVFYVRPTKGQEELHLEVRAVQREEGPVELYFSDHTELVRAAKAAERLQGPAELGVLMGGIAHDTNNALGPIMGLAELALGEGLPPLVVAYLQGIKQAAKGAKRILEAALGSTKVDEAPKAISARGTVEAVVPLLEAIQPKVPLVYSLGTREPTTPDIFMGPRTLGRIVVNLVKNAKEAIGEADGDEGEIQLTIRQEYWRGGKKGEATIPEGAYTVIEVADNGPGMSAELLKKVMEPFFTTKEEGTGLGLGLIGQQVSVVDGRFVLTSREGTGTRAEIYLPTRTVVQIQDHPRGNEHIVVALKEGPSRTLITSQLESLGYTVHLARKPQSVIEIYGGDTKPAMIITQRRVGVLPGKTYVAAARGQDEKTRVLYLVGHETVRAKRNEPGEATLLVGYRLQDLAETVREELDAKVGYDAPTGTKTVMVLDDAKDVANLVGAILRHEGYNCVLVEGGFDTAAVEATIERHGVPDLFLSDLQLPGVTVTLDTYAGLREAHPTMVIGYMTGQPEFDMEGDFPEGTFLIHKPFEVPELVTKVEKYIGKSGAPD